MRPPPGAGGRGRIHSAQEDGGTMRMWGGRFATGTDPLAADFTRSIEVDRALAADDLRGSIAHVHGLGRAGRGRTLGGVDAALVELGRALVGRAERDGEAVMPGMTHIQPAQPVLLAHHLLAYVEMLERDRGRVRAARAPGGRG